MYVIHMMEILNDQMPPANIISSREPYSEGSVSCHILEVHYLKILLLYCICETRTKIVMCALSCVLVSKTRSFLLWIPNTLENIIFSRRLSPILEISMCIFLFFFLSYF